MTQREEMQADLNEIEAALAMDVNDPEGPTADERKQLEVMAAALRKSLSPAMEAEDKAFQKAMKHWK